MDKKDLEARAERRRKLAEGPSLPLAEEIAKAWMDLVVAKGWDPSLQQQIPEGIPVGPDFVSWIDLYLKRSRFRFREFEGAAKLTAQEVARVIDTAGNRLVGRDFPNPLTGVKKEKGQSGYTVVGSNKQTVKTADTVYGPVKYPNRHRNMYQSPFEWTRHCPEHPGVMMHKLPNGNYQCPMKGDVWSYTDGHEVEYKMQIPNQTTQNWNKTFPQKSFLSSPNQQSTRASGGIYDEDAKPKFNKYTENEPVDAKPTTELYAKIKGFTKRAAQKLEIESKVFGPPQVKTRYCPDHEGVMTYRISDDIHQCPIDRAVYNYAQGFKTQDGKQHGGGSVAEMTPDRADYYQSPHPFLVVDSSIKGLTKKAIGLKDEKERQQMQGVREQQKSGLREFQGTADKWAQPEYPLAEAKTEFKSIVEKVLDSKSLPKALMGIEKARSGSDLVKHFYDLLLKHEGQGVIRAGKKQEKKAYSNLESRFVFDLSHVLTSGSPESKKVVELVIANVMRRGQTLPEAIRDAYTVVDQSGPQPVQPAQAMEVTEEQPMQPQEGMSLENPLQ